VLAGDPRGTYGEGFPRSGTWRRRSASDLPLGPPPTSSRWRATFMP